MWYIVYECGFMHDVCLCVHTYKCRIFFQIQVLELSKDALYKQKNPPCNKNNKKMDYQFKSATAVIMLTYDMDITLVLNVTKFKKIKKQKNSCIKCYKKKKKKKKKRESK